MDWVLIAAGLTMLVVGGDALVRGASGIALLARVSPTVVGLTIVAAGTSAPELVVSVQAAIAGKTGLSVGNIVGSNIFNIAAILGLCAVLRPLRIVGNTVKFEWPVMMLASFEFYLLARDSRIDRLEGGFLLSALVAFVAYVSWAGKRTAVKEERPASGDLSTASFVKTGASAIVANVAILAVGVGLLAGGAYILVEGAVGAAKTLGVSDAVVGLTIVAAGTSAPELITSIVAVSRGRDDMAVANVVGSNVFNILGIGGATALIHPLPVGPDILAVDSLWMLAFSAILLPFMISGQRINRAEGALLCGGFLVYMSLLVLRAS